MDSFLSSSQNFVRALKSNSDVLAPSKIEIAREAWDQKSFYAPRKAEVIVEFILTRFLKNEAHSMTDLPSWQLLWDVLHSDSIQSWLGPLISRISFTRIVIQFFESPHDVGRSQLTRIADECIAILWHLYVPKANTELLLECFGASLRLCKRLEPDEHLSHMVGAVASSFQRSLSTSTTKKKMYSGFIQTHLQDWLFSLNQNLSAALLECLYASGCECLLNVDVIRDSKTEASLFNALENISPEIVMPFLPRIFSSYVQILRKNRGAIFGQGSSQKLDSLGEFRELALRFFTLCQPTLNKASKKGEAWKTKALLLDVINQENLLITRHAETERVLSGIVNSIIIELSAGHEGTLGPVVLCLASLTQIDYRLIEDALPDILSWFLLVPDTITPALELLDIILEYHVKTRTVTRYIDILMSVNLQGVMNSDKCRQVYGRLYHSAILHPLHLDRLGKCTREFLPLNQSVTAVRSVTERIKILWEEYHTYSQAGDEPSPRKKRRVDTGSSGNDELTSDVALKLSTAVTFASVVLSYFSAGSVSEKSQQELGMLLNDFSSKIVLHSLSEMFKNVGKKTPNTSSWADEVVVLAFLRLRYALGLQCSPNLSIDTECSSKLILRMSESSQRVQLPELRLEILRTLFKSMPDQQQPALLDITLNILEAIEVSNTFDILHMMIQRWVPLMASQASTTQLERFLVIFMNMQTRSRETSTGVLVFQALASAEFWELPNFRNTLLAYIEQSISVIDNWAAATSAQRELVSVVFDTLLFVPTEYLSRSLRNSLVKRSIMLDQITSSNPNLLLRNLRICITRILSSTDYPENLLSDLNSYLQHLHQGEVFASSSNHIPETRKLIEILIKVLVKHGSSEQFLHLIQRYSENLQPGAFSTYNSWALSFSILVELLLKDHPLKNFSAPAQNILKKLFDDLHKLLFPVLDEFLNDRDISNLTQAKGLLEGWQQILRLGRWLGLVDGMVSLLGERMTQLFSFAIKTSADAPFAVFGVLLEEFNLCEAHMRDHLLGIVIASYVLLAKYWSTALFSAIDNSISSVSATLSPGTFKHALELILCSLKTAIGDEVNALLHISTVLLQDTPLNTFHIVQNFVTECINVFNDRDIFKEGARLSALQLLSQRCRDRPATLRQIDISQIFLFIVKLCAGAEIHTSTTSLETFHHIVSITTALVRLRRDLVLLTIPHLGIVLRRLIQSMQSPRPSLGPKQAAMMSQGLPSWVNTREPLGAAESKALARLLESLTTKTVVKKLTSSATVMPKAESLAKPFSKHAAYVIKAYVESLNDPLCVLPAAVRKELQPGLYALCRMMNDFSRDALMVSTTDAGEKAVVKALWREYEKQRYVGKG